MSKLIVDDIELASGDMLPIPASIPQDGLIPVSNGAISSVGQALPTSNMTLHHDFSTGQPEYSTYTLSVPSDQLFGVRVLFSNFQIYSGAGWDIVYDAITDADDTVYNPNDNNGGLNTGMYYSAVGIRARNSVSMEDSGSGAGQSGIHMGGPRSSVSANLSQPGVRAQVEHWDHYMSFGKGVTGGRYYRKVIAHGFNRDYNNTSGPLGYTFGSVEWTNDYTSTTTNAQSSPFTTLKFRHETSYMSISQGKIFIMEIKK